MPFGTARRLAIEAEEKLLLSWLAIGDALAAIILSLVDLSYESKIEAAPSRCDEEEISKSKRLEIACADVAWQKIGFVRCCGS